MSSDAWATATRRAGVCAIPGCTRSGAGAHGTAWDTKLEGHHIVPRRYLNSVVRERGLVGEDANRIVWNLANHLPLCAYHHNRHERALERVPRHVLPDAALAFAEDVGLTWLVEKAYPQGVPEGKG